MPIQGENWKPLKISLLPRMHPELYKRNIGHIVFIFLCVLCFNKIKLQSEIYFFHKMIIRFILLDLSFMKKTELGLFFLFDPLNNHRSLMKSTGIGKYLPFHFNGLPSSQTRYVGIGCDWLSFVTGPRIIYNGSCNLCSIAIY